MKKFFTTLLMLTALVSMNAQDDNVYILGNVGDQQWEPSIGTQMEFTGDGMYEYEGHFNTGSYFSFTTQLAETPGDWDAIAPYSFGASSDGYVIDDNNLGEYIQCGEIEVSKDNAFCFTAGGNYHIYLLLEDRIIMVERIGAADVDPDPVDEGKIYIIGDAAKGWVTNAGIEMTKGENNIFTAIVNVADSAASFSFTHALALSAATWPAIAPFRFAAVAPEDFEGGNVEVVLGEALPVSEDGVSEPSFIITQGRYLFTLDMEARTLTVTEAEAPEGMFLIGSLNGWDPEHGLEMTANGDIYTYSGTNTGKLQFIFANTQDVWNNINNGEHRYGPADGDADIALGEEVTTQLTGDTGCYNVTIDGEYTITFNKANLTFKVEAGGSTPGVKGDVDGNGLVDVEDVNAAINIVLKLANASDYQGSADLDNNGIVDVEDVNAMINIILKL